MKNKYELPTILIELISNPDVIASSTSGSGGSSGSGLDDVAHGTNSEAHVNFNDL